MKQVVKAPRIDIAQERNIPAEEFSRHVGMEIGALTRPTLADQARHIVVSRDYTLNTRAGA
jgi:hypothetical protein